MGGAPRRYRLPLRPVPDNVMSVGHITSIGERRPTSSHLTSLPSQTMSFTLELAESMTRMLPPRWEYTVHHVRLQVCISYEAAEP